MLLFPAIDLLSGQAVRLLRGDYRTATIYSTDPPALAASFAQAGATHLHLVDLEGARDSGTPNFSVVEQIKKTTGLFCQLGGGVRDLPTARRYFDAGIDRVILGTAAVEDPDLLAAAVAAFGPKIAVGADVQDGFLALRGWTQQSRRTLPDFCADLEALGVATVICTDISLDGALAGTNRALYADLAHRTHLAIVASGGVSSLEDIRALRALGLSGAIVGKALYTGALDLKAALEAAR